MSFHPTIFDPASDSAELRLVPKAIDLHRCLTPLADARPGDLVAMMSVRPEARSPSRHAPLTPIRFCVKTDRGLVATSYADLTGPARDKAEQTVGAVLHFPDPEGLDARDEDEQPGRADQRVMHLADAIVSVQENWLFLSCDDIPAHPVELQTALAPDLIAAHELRRRLCCYLTEFRLMLPALLNKRMSWDLRIPELHELLTPAAQARIFGASNPWR